MFKYEDFKGTAQELFDLLKENGYELYFYPATEDYYAYMQAYEPEATQEEIKIQHKYAVDVTYDGNSIIEIDSWVSAPDEDEETEDDYEYDDFEARHDGSYLWD